MTEDEARATKRQARGEKRIEQILAAAAEVFADAGYEAATTNAIARRAGISPGSLYQFFGNKEEIARALAEHYTGLLRAMRDDAFAVADPAEAPLEDVVRQVTDSIVEFNLVNRGFKALFARTDTPPALTQVTAPMRQAIHERVAALLQSRAPDTDRADLERAATVAVQIVRALTPLIAAAEGAERDRLVQELRTVLVAYLSPGFG